MKTVIRSKKISSFIRGGVLVVATIGSLGTFARAEDPEEIAAKYITIRIEKLVEKMSIDSQEESLIKTQKSFIHLISCNKDTADMLGKVPDMPKDFEFTTSNVKSIHQLLQDPINSYYKTLLNNVEEQKRKNMEQLTCFNQESLIANAKEIKYALISDNLERKFERADDLGYPGCHW